MTVEQNFRLRNRKAWSNLKGIVVFERRDPSIRIRKNKFDSPMGFICVCVNK